MIVIFAHTNSYCAWRLRFPNALINLLMKKQHQLAAKAILNKRNSNSKAILDLHGLHVKEAIEFLKETLNAFKNQTKSDLRPFYILTGTGHHSKSSNPRLLPAVLDVLEESGLKFIDCSMDGKSGMLRLNV